MTEMLKPMPEDLSAMRHSLNEQSDRVTDLTSYVQRVDGGVNTTWDSLKRTWDNHHKRVTACDQGYQHSIVNAADVAVTSSTEKIGANHADSREGSLGRNRLKPGAI